MQVFHLGDMVMPPGNGKRQSDGTQQKYDGYNFYPEGGAQFCHEPSQDSTCQQWQINPQSPPYVERLSTLLYGLDSQLDVSFLNDPATHFNFGSYLGTYRVYGCSGPHAQRSAHTVGFVEQILGILAHPTGGCVPPVLTPYTPDDTGFATQDRRVRHVLQTANVSNQTEQAPIPPHQSQRKVGAYAPTNLVLRNANARLILVFTPRKQRKYSSPFTFYIQGQGSYQGWLTARTRTKLTDLRGTGTRQAIHTGHRVTTSHLRLQGQLDTTSLRATIDIWMTTGRVQRHYRLQTPVVSVRNAASIVRRVDSTLQAHHLTAIYNLLPTSFQNATVRRQLALASQSSATKAIIEIKAQGAGHELNGAIGYTFYVQPVVVRMHTASGIRVGTTQLELVWDGGAWHFWSFA